MDDLVAAYDPDEPGNGPLQRDRNSKAVGVPFRLHAQTDVLNRVQGREYHAVMVARNFHPNSTRIIYDNPLDMLALRHQQRKFSASDGAQGGR